MGLCNASQQRGGSSHPAPDGVRPVSCQGWCGLGTRQPMLLSACFRNQAASWPQTCKHQISMREKKTHLLYLIVGCGGSLKLDDSLIFVLIRILHALLQSSLCPPPPPLFFCFNLCKNACRGQERQASPGSRRHWPRHRWLSHILFPCSPVTFCRFGPGRILCLLVLRHQGEALNECMSCLGQSPKVGKKWFQSSTQHLVSQ